MAQIKAIWNSSKGYSKPNEIVELTGNYHGDLEQIKVEADAEEKETLDIEFFSYWVHRNELQIIE